MKDVIDVFKSLTDETRLRILKLLETGELCVCEIVAAVNIVQPKISFHLRTLKRAGLVKDTKHGKWTHYRLDDSDIFKRFLLISVLERIESDKILKDRSRLEKFRQGKDVAAACGKC
ncbi:MAG TPA: metalloregulator ArsR/SmtB family transcription factor [Dissulfurispiraceae bacterium]|nr:metalloregulator ArsR/SmtB family transcription factor [Dissulfurispiraceae bacterium]